MPIALSRQKSIKLPVNALFRFLCQGERVKAIPEGGVRMRSGICGTAACWTARKLRDDRCASSMPLNLPAVTPSLAANHM